MLAFSTGRDPRGVTFAALRAGLNFRAAIVMSAREDDVSAYRTLPTGPALLVVQSAADQCNPAFRAVHLYRDIQQRDKWFLELLMAHHLPPINGEDATGFKMVAGVSTLFLQLSTPVPRPSRSLMIYGNGQPAVARTFHGGQGPTIRTITPPFVCGPH